MKKLFLPAVLLVIFIACSPATEQSESDTIHWDSWGVPHILAGTDAGFFFADGWAQMHAHANTLLRLYGSSRGRAAEYWGEAHFANDVMVHTLGHPDYAKQMWAEQDPALKSLISAFVDGVNAYAEKYPETIDEENLQVLPVIAEDVNLHAQFVVNSRFIAGRELQISRSWDENGSNAYAIAPSRSESGHAMLVQNPHLPWSGEFLWFEKHALTPGQNIYGANLVGLPGFAIAFNDHLGWTHTNNTIDNSDLYELTLDGDAYRYGEGSQPFETKAVTLKVRNTEGMLDEKIVEVRRSIHGPVISAGESKALALRFAAKNANNAILQWWKMANANSFREFETA